MESVYSQGLTHSVFRAVKTLRLGTLGSYIAFRNNSVILRRNMEIDMLENKTGMKLRPYAKQAFTNRFTFTGLTGF